MAYDTHVLWLALGVACILGYFVVSKVIDFFTVKQNQEQTPSTVDKKDDGLIGGHDPNKPIG